MRVHCIYPNYLTPDGSAMSIGGIQTYITNLIEVAKGLGYEFTVYQCATESFDKEQNGARVCGIVCSPQQAPQMMLAACLKEFDVEKDILLFGTDTYICKTPAGVKSIGIQHGIFWDKPERLGCSRLWYFAEYVYQCLKDWRTVKRIERVKRLVCVDYNFPNWYRALVAHPRIITTVIPNFAEIAAENTAKQADDDTIRIIFARRLFSYRGTRVFGRAAKRLLAEHDNLEITVAGTGPDEKWLHDTLGQYDSVRFITYGSAESLAVHEDKHIAVVPTTGSEGTSLSLLEAMSAGCAVVCTSVGGMTDIVIDGYNGLMVNPSEEDIYRALKRLVEDAALRQALARRGYDTVKNGFSLEIWQEKWKQVLQDM